MKVLLVHNRYQERGGEDTVFAFERDMLQASGVGVETHVADNDAISSWATKFKAFWRVTGNQTEVAAVVERVKAGGFDLVHVHNFFPLVSPGLHPALARAGVPVVQTLHNYRLMCANGVFLRDGAICEACVTHGRYRAVVHRCYKGSAMGSLAVVRMQRAALGNPGWVDSVSRFIALTRFAQDSFITHGIPAARITVKPNSVKDPGPAPVPWAERRGVLFVGRLSREKGLRVLLEAWAAGAGAGQQLTVIGDGPERAEMQAMSGDAVHFTGLLPREEVLAHMQRAAVLVIPSTWYEGFPATLVEALACGLPVIAPRLGGFPEMVEPGLNGWLFPPADSAALAETLRAALADPALLQRMGEGARATYDLRYAPRRNRDQLLAIYRDVLAERAGPP